MKTLLSLAAAIVGAALLVNQAQASPIAPVSAGIHTLADVGLDIPVHEVGFKKFGRRGFGHRRFGRGFRTHKGYHGKRSFRGHRGHGHHGTRVFRRHGGHKIRSKKVIVPFRIFIK